MARETLTESQEQFCQLVVRLGNLTKAYDLSHPTNKMKNAAIRVKASNMAKQPKIQARIKEVREERLDQLSISPEYVVERHRQMYEECREQGKYAAATRNLQKIGETMGIYKDNLMVTGDLSEISDEELKERIKNAIGACEDKELIKEFAGTLKETWGKLRDGEGFGG